MKSCEKVCHNDCLSRLSEEFKEKVSLFYGDNANLLVNSGQTIVSSPDLAEVLIITGEGLVSEKRSRISGNYLLTKKIVFIGPSTAGVTALLGCITGAYGRS